MKTIGAQIMTVTKEVLKAKTKVPPLFFAAKFQIACSSAAIITKDREIVDKLLHGLK
jgi:hypothetical protein